MKAGNKEKEKIHIFQTASMPTMPKPTARLSLFSSPPISFNLSRRDLVVFLVTQIVPEVLRLRCGG